MAYTLNPDDKFGVKDTLAEGHPEKKILGVEFDDEFNKISTAVETINLDIGDLIANSGFPEPPESEGDDLKAYSRAYYNSDPDDDAVAIGMWVEAPSFEDFEELKGKVDAIDPDADASIGWDEVTDKPTEFPPAAHGHEEITKSEENKPTAYIRYADDTWKASPSLEVEGDLTVGGDTTIGGLTVNGDITIDGGTINTPDGGTYLTDAPSDGSQYARRDAAWSIVEATDSANPVVISDDPPDSPEEGDLWYCSKADQEGLYCWDGAVWFGTESPNSAGLEEAPEDGKQYARRNVSWSEVVIPTVDLSSYATEVYVDNAIAAIPAAPVDSVNGKTGAVVLSAADVGASTFSGNYADLAGKPTLYDGADAVKISGNQTIDGVKTFNQDLRSKANVVAYYSDIRLKDIQGPIENPIEKVEAIETFYYTHGDRARELGYEGSEIQVGVSAQSVQAVAPELIHRAPVDDDGEGGSVTGESYITVDYPRLVPLLIESIKQLSAEIEELKK